jgi:hypothetical protein
MRITNIEKTTLTSFKSIIKSRSVSTLVVFTCVIFLFSSFFDIVIIIFHIPDAYATLDTFSARGTIFIPIDDIISSNDIKTQLPLSSSPSTPNQSTVSINNNNINNTDSTTNTNNTIAKEVEEQNYNSSTIQNIKGQWNLKINKGNPEVFNTLLVSYDQNGIPKNAYGIYNLRDVKFIQLDNLGNEIINGKVDLRSVGEVNKTITGIDTTFIIERLQNIQLIVNNETAMSIPNFFNKPIIGKTILMADGIGKILVDKRPKASSSSVPVLPNVPPDLPSHPPSSSRQPSSSLPHLYPNSPNTVPPDNKPPPLNLHDTKRR